MPNNVKKLIIDGVTYDLSGGGLQPYTGIPFEFGTYDTNDNSWDYSDFTQSPIWTEQDPSWFTFLEPFVEFIPRLEAPIDSYRSYRIADRTTVEATPDSWVAGNMMGMFAWAITSGLNLKSKAYYGIPNAPDKLLLVTIELTAGALTTNTAQIISAGGGGGVTITGTLDKNPNQITMIYGPDKSGHLIYDFITYVSVATGSLFAGFGNDVSLLSGGKVAGVSGTYVQNNTTKAIGGDPQSAVYNVAVDLNSKAVTATVNGTVNDVCLTVRVIK